jgi:hypothetical protein
VDARIQVVGFKDVFLKDLRGGKGGPGLAGSGDELAGVLGVVVSGNVGVCRGG